MLDNILNLTFTSILVYSRSLRLGFSFDSVFFIVLISLFNFFRSLLVEYDNSKFSSISLVTAFLL
jgi:hypothetical protein